MAGSSGHIYPGAYVEACRVLILGKGSVSIFHDSVLPVWQELLGNPSHEGDCSSQPAKNSLLLHAGSFRKLRPGIIPGSHHSTYVVQIFLPLFHGTRENSGGESRKFQNESRCKRATKVDHIINKAATALVSSAAAPSNPHR